jgi:hypothetical protein
MMRASRERWYSRSTRDRLPKRAGIKPGDPVAELNRTLVRGAADLRIRLALLRIGEFALSRSGSTLRARAAMAEREPAKRPIASKLPVCLR